jgi:hypothetical protein
MENPKLQASLGLAFSMGCLMAVLAIVALLLGLWIDRTFLSGGRIATAVCVIASIPINLIVALRITQIMLKRIIPLNTGKKVDKDTTPPNLADIDN